MDTAVNQPLKTDLRKRFSRWYADEVAASLRANGGNPSLVKVDVSLARIKNRFVQWLIEALKTVEAGEYVREGWRIAMNKTYKLFCLSCFFCAIIFLSTFVST